jgi:hypothetical protein
MDERSNSGSDLDTDEELDGDITDEIAYLTDLEKKTQEDRDRLVTLKKLLRDEIQRRGPLPPVPDFWNHGSKNTEAQNTEAQSTEPKSTKIPISALLNKEPTDTSNENKVTPAVPSDSKINENSLQKGNEVPQNISESTSTSTSTTSTQLNESTSEKPKQTPTEYVHELESTEPTSYVWDDSD